ncbi:MAG: 30S ribosomal protein S5 [Mycoplasmataceae bacterium]|jgi:small subunit ribosomal protein S5|nr:30S ribosomal protein S5 [Mycoplasmataceae bacterium]
MLENKEKIEATNEEATTKVDVSASKANTETKERINKKPITSFKKRTNTRTSRTGFEEKVVGIKRINKTTKGGRHMRFSALVVVGDKHGKVGFGIGKSTEVPNAIRKAIKNANNNVSSIIMNKNFTVYHEIVGRHGASKVLLKPAPVGTGIVAGGAIRAVIELAGFKDIYTKNLGSNTSINMVRATLNGLLNQKHPKYFADLRDKDIKSL